MSFVKYLQKRIALMAWLILAGIAMTFFVCKPCRESFSYFASISGLTILCWTLMYLGNEYLHEYLDEKINWTKYPVKRLTLGLLALTVYTVAMTYIIVYSANTIFKLRIGAVSTTIYMSMGITLVISLILTSRSFLVNWRQTAIDAEKFKQESTVAKFESLRNQVNPHFLFNSLNVLTNLVYENPDKAAKFIKQLSEVYRYLLDTRDKEVVQLDEEEKFLKSYQYLQEIRFGGKLTITVSLDDADCMVAPLALQMLVENAIKHNEISEEHPLHIRLFMEPDFVVVENNLQPKRILDEKSLGLGLDNICKRYEFLTDRKVQVSKNGTFAVRLPKIHRMS
jgi:LytS/YehU family sensor histidine kinase